MKKSPYRTILILAVLVIAVVNVYPTIGWMTLSEEQREKRLENWREEDLLQAEPNLFSDMWRGLKRWSEFDRSKVINLGLDLQGGIHVVLGLDVDAVWDRLEEQHPKWSRQDIIRQAQEETLRRIKRRVNEFEAKEPIIQTLGDRQIQVQLPGEKDRERAIKLLTRAAYLEFYIVALKDKTLTALQALNEHYEGAFGPQIHQPALGQVQPFTVDSEKIDRVREMVDKAREDGALPDDVFIAFSEEPQPWETDQSYEMWVLEAPPAMSGEGLEEAAPQPDEERGQGSWLIAFRFDAQGSDDFFEVTKDNVGRQLAVVVDKACVSAPVINEPIPGRGVIQGQFTAQEANDLAIALNSGAMNVPLKIESTAVVGPTLGTQSIRRGVYSAAIGMAFVVVFMLIYYRMSGLIANLALLVNALLVVAALAYFGATLTLPGIAGMILTIGMAVDANVLIYERIREEIKNGRSLLASIDSGFARATITILDANVTTLIAAAVLMEFGTGPIEGFAVTLSIGVCSSVFSALIVSRAIFDLFSARKWVTEKTIAPPLKGETSFKFLDRRRIALAGSAVVIAIGMATFGLRGEDNFGVDFRTGTSMVVNLQSDEVLDEASVRAALEGAGFSEPSVVAYERDAAEAQNQFLIRVNETAALQEETAQAQTPPEPGETAAAEIEEMAEAAEAEDDAGVVDGEADSEAGEPAAAEEGLDTVADDVIAAVSPLCDEVVVAKVDTVGPAIGSQLKWDAIKSIAAALVFIIAYLWFRFELKFAVGAVAALVHDVLVTVGLFAVFGRQLSLPVVAALLTIIGYSLNDTIVVFDRVREDLRLHRGRGMTFAEIMDLSINQTLRRTLLTSLTTLFVVVVLTIFGGAVIRDFALALTMGVIVGTYSSIFVASPVVYFWQKAQGKHLATPHGGEPSRKRGGKKKGKKSKGQEATA